MWKPKVPDPNETKPRKLSFANSGGETPKASPKQKPASPPGSPASSPKAKPAADPKPVAKKAEPVAKEAEPVAKKAEPVVKKAEAKPSPVEEKKRKSPLWWKNLSWTRERYAKAYAEDKAKPKDDTPTIAGKAKKGRN